jgi:hypothetical protein
MAEYDATEFVDGDFQTRKSPYATAGGGLRAPTREEVDSRVAEAQQKLSELKRAQEELERERSALEETRRRQAEFQTGRSEMVQNLTRGLGLLEEVEFAARRDAEQAARALVDLRDALAKVQAIREDGWNQENFNVELTRALTVVENARMEWNGARLKFGVLAGAAKETTTAGAEAAAETPLFNDRSFAGLCKIGLALTWPLVLVILLAAGVLILVVLQRR